MNDYFLFFASPDGDNADKNKQSLRFVHELRQEAMVKSQTGLVRSTSHFDDDFWSWLLYDIKIVFEKNSKPVSVIQIAVKTWQERWDMLLQYDEKEISQLPLDWIGRWAIECLALQTYLPSLELNGGLDYEYQKACAKVKQLAWVLQYIHQKRFEFWLLNVYK